MKRPYCIVRRGADVQTDDGRQWQLIVHRCPCSHDTTAYRVCLHGPSTTILVSRFDVHHGRYDSELEETTVTLSAVGHACQTAADLEATADYVHGNRIAAFIARAAA